MFIDIHELERDPLEFAQQFPAGLLDLGRDAAQVEPLQTEGVAELLEKEIHLQGHLHTAVRVTCARCLEPMEQVIDKDFDLYYRPVSSIAHEEEIQIDDDELEIGFYQGNGLQLEDVLKEQVLLDIPMKSLCRDDCRGLCPQCGQNRNAVNCACPAMPGDIRWTPLAEFKK